MGVGSTAAAKGNVLVEAQQQKVIGAVQNLKGWVLVCEQGKCSGSAVQIDEAVQRGSSVCVVSISLHLLQLEESEARCTEAQRSQQAAAQELENLHVEMEMLSRNKTLVRSWGSVVLGAGISLFTESPALAAQWIGRLKARSNP